MKWWFFALVGMMLFSVSVAEASKPYEPDIAMGVQLDSIDAYFAADQPDDWLNSRELWFNYQKTMKYRQSKNTRYKNYCKHKLCNRHNSYF